MATHTSFRPAGAQPMRHRILFAAVFAATVCALQARAQTQLVQGPSSSRTPYIVGTAPFGSVHSITSIVTTTDLVALTGGEIGRAHV